MQYYPMILLPVVFWMFPKYRYTAGRYLAWVVGWYGLSKVLEHFDGEIFDLLGHTVSGHSLKHLAAAVATFVILRMCLSRRSYCVINSLWFGSCRGWFAGSMDIGAVSWPALRR